jgi:integrase
MLIFIITQNHSNPLMHPPICYNGVIKKPGGVEMPKVKFSPAMLRNIKPSGDKGTWFSDTECKGLQLWAGISGENTWYVHYRQPDTRKLAYQKIGDADFFSVSQARDAARAFLADVQRGKTPWMKPEVTATPTLEAFIREKYAPWVLEHRRSGKETLAMLEQAFSVFYKKRLDEISVADLEEWRTKKRSERGSKASTLNRQVTALRAALNWALKRGIMENHLLIRFERLPEEDSDTKIRYLFPEERERLFAALGAREERIRAERDSHNEWLDGRKREALPSLRSGAFVDYLKPMLIVALNTGIRRRSLFRLLWSDIDFREEILTVRAETAKAGKEIHIPMNELLSRTLADWKAQTGGDGDELVFPSPKSGEVFNNVRRAWDGVLKAADIKKFRWHDMRHDFASQLVMKGVDLNTVRELMGHADLKMTLRYAHLAPRAKRAAVELLE